jgi:hypothetical protein
VSGIVISFVSCATDTATHDVSVEKILEAIRSGGKNLKGQIQQIRNQFEAELAITSDRKKAKLAIDRLKKQLPAVMWSGMFSARANDKLLKHSGLLCADLDSLDASLAEVWDKLRKSVHIWLLFLSPTGDGLKAVFRVPADASKHLASFRAVEQHVRNLTGLQIDQACKDPARLCFMSYDSDLYVNESAVQLEPLPEPEKPQPSTHTGLVDLSARQRIATEMIGAIDWQSETSGFCVCPGKHLHTTGDSARDCKIILDGVPTVYCFHNSCGGILAAVNRELRSRIARAENQTHPEFTSLSSPVVDDYPAPPDEAAFYGLAGKIVRRILPETEADPVALLFQVLAAFGNIIGPTAYMVADGARHYCNIFGVLVGETSKGRKGTAWRRILSILQHLDLPWCNECVAHGLSSGEGLIWAVRDPILEEKPIKEKGRHTGEYETVMIDRGVEDKRLLVIESEFANPIKVATREGNILSAIIRCAWETDSLRTMAKNSPARATGAHISIVGHITRQENRRLLTETESANGFANRFCWLAVRRSKFLPEGGEAVGIADLVNDLQNAIEFAKSAGELKRDQAARELWACVYPKVSEGKPGLLGAIIARAEAQALRFQEIYALLDCSNVVRVEHLRAALALWDYSERSATWIFAAGTGNKNADKILAALKAAGENGLTRLQITNEVFNRNATKFEIDDGLRLLHSLNVAIAKMEGTATRPSEHWFFKAQPYEQYE